MKSIIIYFSIFIMFDKYFCQFSTLKMMLTAGYDNRAYVSGLGTEYVFNETKLTKKIVQNFYFSHRSAAGKHIGFQLRLPTTDRLFIEHFNEEHYQRYLYRSTIRGPITVLMHKTYEVTIHADDYFNDLYVSLIGTSKKTREFQFYNIKSKIAIMMDSDIGKLTGISIRIQWSKSLTDFPNIKNATVKYDGKVYTFIIDSKIKGPATLIKVLDRYRYKCYWTEWTKIISKYRDVARQRYCFKYGVANEKCDTCVGDSVQFLFNEDGGLVHRTRTAGQNKALHGVIAVLVISMLLNAAMIGLAVYYRRQILMQKDSTYEMTDYQTQTTDYKRDSYLDSSI